MPQRKLAGKTRNKVKAYCQDYIDANGCQGGLQVTVNNIERYQQLNNNEG